MNEQLHKNLASALWNVSHSTGVMSDTDRHYLAKALEEWHDAIIKSVANIIRHGDGDQFKRVT